jgi:hypothetical protein
VAARTPCGLWGWPGPPPCHLFPFFVFFFEFEFEFFFKKISIFIYFLINLYYFIKMDMSAPSVANKMATPGPERHLTESVKIFNGI